MHATNNIAVYMRWIVKILIVHFRHTDPSKLYDVNQHVTHLGWGLCTKENYILFYARSSRHYHISTYFPHLKNNIFSTFNVFSRLFIQKFICSMHKPDREFCHIIITFVCMHDMKKNPLMIRVRIGPPHYSLYAVIGPPHYSFYAVIGNYTWWFCFFR